MDFLGILFLAICNLVAKGYAQPGKHNTVPIVESIILLSFQSTWHWALVLVSSLTTLISSSLTLERMLLVVCPLSPATLTLLLAAVGVTMVVMENWGSGPILMEEWFRIMLVRHMPRSNSILWGMLPNSSDYTVEVATTFSLRLGPTVALYPPLKETWPSVQTLTFVSISHCQ